MILYAMRSRAGDRKKNEDNIRMERKAGEYLFALADGLGGHGKGEEASRIATEQACHVFSCCEPGTRCLEDAFQSSQHRILAEKEQRRLFSAMKTTMVLLRIEKEQTAEWAHMGDSRLYVFSGGRVETRTKDHSVPQMLVLTGEIEESEIRHHPDRSRVLRALGDDSEGCRCEVSKPYTVQKDCAFLLCTDGFWELIVEADMERTLRHASSPAQWLDEMEKIVLKNGADVNMDNYSAIAVWVMEG